MHNTVLLLHSWLRWAVLALLLLSMAQAFRGWLGQKEWNSQQQRLHLFTLIATDLQLLLGLWLYFISGSWGKLLFSQTKLVMKTRSMRYFAVEHLILMLVAVALIHIGYARAKRLPEATSRYKAAAVFFTLALLAILASIPWPFLSNIGRPWLRF